MCAMIPMFRVRTSGYSRITRALLAPPVAVRPASLAACATWSSFLAGVPISRSPNCHPPGSPRARPRIPLRSPSVVRERLVRFRHLVHVLAPLHRGTLAVRGVHDLGRQPLGHRVLASLARVVHQPAKRQRGPPLGTNLHGDLVGRTADPPRLHLEERP